MFAKLPGNHSWVFDLIAPDDVVRHRALARHQTLLTAASEALQWEASYPQEWHAPGSWMWSPWGTKEGILRGLDRDGVPGRVRPQIGDLIVTALQRPYRCKDWMYARLVRHVLDMPFVSKIEALLDAEDPLVRLRAQFILDVARNPQRGIKRASWHRWLSRLTSPPSEACTKER